MNETQMLTPSTVLMYLQTALIAVAAAHPDPARLLHHFDVAAMAVADTTLFSSMTDGERHAHEALCREFRRLLATLSGSGP